MTLSCELDRRAWAPAPPLQGLWRRLPGHAHLPACGAPGSAGTASSADSAAERTARAVAARILGQLWATLQRDWLWWVGACAGQAAFVQVQGEGPTAEQGGLCRAPVPPRGAVHAARGEGGGTPSYVGPPQLQCRYRCDALTAVRHTPHLCTFGLARRRTEANPNRCGKLGCAHVWSHAGRLMGYVLSYGTFLENASRSVSWPPTKRRVSGCRHMPFTVVISDRLKF